MYLTQGLHRALQRHPDAIALTHVSDAGERHWTFTEVVDAVGRQAAYLQARGIRANDRVALLSPNSDHLIQAILACWWLGAVACPMNTRWSEAELEYALNDSDADRDVARVLRDLLTTSVFTGQARELRNHRCHQLHHDGCGDVWHDAEGEDAGLLETATGEHRQQSGDPACGALRVLSFEMVEPCFDDGSIDTGKGHVNPQTDDDDQSEGEENAVPQFWDLPSVSKRRNHG